jgi:beta-lactamase regulating signal transducer with metallopeptidase domain
MSVALVYFIWQGTLVACLLGLTLRAMRGRSPNARYLVSCGALLLMALAPAATALVVYSRPTPVRAVLSALRSAESMPIVSTGGLRPDGVEWVLPIWCAGVLFSSLRLLWGYRRISVVRRAAEKPSESLAMIVSGLARRIGLTRLVDLRVTLAAESPGVVGWLRPVVLVPAATIAGLTPEQLEAVLAHELAHIRRYDYLVNAAQVLVETLLFYHPAVWWTSAQIRRERELCCDDLAVGCCGNALCYARALTRLERLRPDGVNLAVGSTSGPLGYRIRRLLGTAGQESGNSKLPVVLGLCAALVCAMFYLSEVRAQTKPQQPPPAEPRSAPEKRDEPACDGREIKDDRFLEWLALRREKKEMEMAHVRMYAQMEYLSAIPKPRQPANAAPGRLADVDQAISQAEERIAMLRETLARAHPDVQAAERQLRDLQAERGRSAAAAAEYAGSKAKMAHIEESIERLKLDMVGNEAVIRVKEAEMNEIKTRLTARQKACLAR